MRKLLFAFLLLAPLSARASTFDIYGFGSRGIAMGGAQTADARDFSATFYNPSLLVLQTKVGFGLGFFYEAPNVSATPDVPTASFGTEPESTAAWSAGLVFPFAGKLRNHVALGVGISIPTKNLLRVASFDPGEPTWYLYENSPDRIQIFAGLGIKPFDWLTLGIGIQALADFSGHVDFNVDIFNKRFQKRDLTNELATREAPVAGLTIIPTSNFQFAFCWRASMELDYALPTSIQLGDLGTLGLNVSGVTFYTPHELTLGVKYEPIPELTLTADLEYALWSKAPSPAVNVSVRFTGDLAQGLGLDQALKLDSSDAPIGFEDVLIPRLGIEYRLGENVSFRGGYYFRPTMLPEQNGLTNLLDGPTHVISAGLGVSFMSPLGALAEPVKIDAVFQHGFVGGRHADKSASNPVQPYSYGGSTEVFAIDLRYAFDIVGPKDETPAQPEPAQPEAQKPERDEFQY